MKRIIAMSIMLLFVFIGVGNLFAQQQPTAGQVFDNSRPATGQGNAISTSTIPIKLPPPPPPVKAVPVKSTNTGK